MATKILIDTCIFIDYARAETGLYLPLLESSKQKTAQLFTSTISIAEFYSGQSMQKKNKIQAAEKLFKPIIKVDLNEKIAQQTGILLRTRTITGFDAIIAATALELNAKLATNNIKHFAKVKKLKLFS